MREISKILTLASLLMMQPISASAAQETELSSQNAAALKMALNRGQKIYQYDQAAWYSTDAMQEDVKDLNNSGIIGWIITEHSKGLLSTFYRKTDDGFAGVYSAILPYNNKQVIDRKILSGDDTKLNEEQIKLIKARTAVQNDNEIEIKRCSDRPFNTVVMSGETADDPILIYYLTPQTTLEAVPFGGHHRFSVKDEKIISHRKFTNSCIDLSLKGKGNKPEALTISHILDPVPTEIHVFSVYAAKLPIYVLTTVNENIWAVEIVGGEPRARLIDQSE